MTKFKTVELLTRCSRGQIKTYRESLADKFIKTGLAKPVDEEDLAKYEAEEKAKAEKIAKEKAKKEAEAKKAAEKQAKELAKQEKDAKKKK